MRRLTGNDMVNLAGAIIAGHKVEGVRIKRGEFSDSDHYGILLGRSLTSDRYVTWQFHLDEDENPTLYWGHYFMDNREAAINDFNFRDLPAAPKLSTEHWDCECDEKYIHPNSEDQCPLCGALRAEMPDSRQDEVDEGTNFAG